jgi:hypothetical protein
MLGLGIISRIGSGFIADRIGGVRTLIIGLVMQGGRCSLSIFRQRVFALHHFRVVRHRADIRDRRARIFSGKGALGMAPGGWMSGEIFDLTGSYQVTFLNGSARTCSMF